jgi:hypothetical protein
MLIERYPDGSMEMLLAYEGQKVDKSIITAELIQETVSKFNEEGTRHLYHTELGHPKWKHLDITMSGVFNTLGFKHSEESYSGQDFHRFYTIDLNNVCGVITEMYSYYHEGLNKTVLTGVWTPSGIHREVANKLIEEMGEVKLGIRSISERGVVLKIVTWDFVNVDIAYYDALQMNLGTYGVDLLLEDLRLNATKRKESHAN